MSDFADLARAANAARTARPGVPLALATLVRVEGSSYRQPGARLLVDAEHRVLAGAISGGCLEGDVAARAADVCANGVAMELIYDLRDDLQTIWGFGSACDGVAHILLEPLPEPSWLDHAAAIRHARDGGVVVTVVSESALGGTVALYAGSAAAGSWHAERGGADALLEAARPLLDRALNTARPVLDRIEVKGTALSVFAEPLVPTVALYLVGAGRGAEAFAHIATTLGWDVTMIDHRQALLDSLTLPASVSVRCLRADDGAALITRDSRTAVALLSHIFDTDLEWLTALLPLSLGYVGVLGSRLRAAKLFEMLSEHGTAITPAMRHVLHAPIGLDLGGESPASIALAAIAEIEAVMHGRPGAALRDRESPIHTRTRTPG